MGVALQANNKEVEDYCRNWHGWRQVLRLLECEEFDDITKNCKSWETNDGEGLEAHDCKELAKRLKIPVQRLIEFVEFLDSCEGFKIY